MNKYKPIEHNKNGVKIKKNCMKYFWVLLKNKKWIKKRGIRFVLGGVSE